MTLAAAGYAFIVGVVTGFIGMLIFLDWIEGDEEEE